MADIDNLSIVLTANADNAARAIDRLISPMQRLGTGASEGASGVRDASEAVKDYGAETRKTGNEAGKAQKPVKQLNKDIKDSGKAAKESSSGLKTFWESLKRIAFYRAVRSIIRSITDAFKEGITNMYQWSSAVNGQFARSMDRIATSTLYLKNSLGAMLAPLINTLAPIIEWIIDRIVEVINWINKLFAALSGSQTYTVAKKVATTWGDAGKTASGSAKKAAEDIRRTILGFDEINKLEKERESSGGGGSGSSAAKDYTSMFETRQLDGWMAKLAGWIGKFNDLTGSTFGSILAGFAAVELAIAGIKALTSGWLRDLAGATVSIFVNLVRNGWTSITSWALSFGEAVLPVAVVLGVTALALWLAFKLDWAKIGEKALEVGIKLKNTAAELWLNLQLGWNTVKDKALSVAVQIITSAATLWMGLQLAWSVLGEKALKAKAVITTTAAELWLGLQLAWSALGEKVFNLKAQIVTAASDLWLNMQVAWSSLSNKVLKVAAAISTTAADLWLNLQLAWGSVESKVLKAKIAIVNKASELWGEIKADWGSVTSHVFSAMISLTTTATKLWSKLKADWGDASKHVLDVSINLVSQGWTNITGWLKERAGDFVKWTNDVGASISVGVSVFKSGWKSLADWFKENSGEILKWVGITAATIGIGVAIITGAPALAASLGALWAKVTALIGGALPIVIAPAMAESDDPYYTSGSQYTQAWYDTHIKPLEDMANNTTLDLTVDAWTVWGNLNQSLEKYVGATGLSTTIAILTETVWDHFGKSIKQYLGLNDLKTTVKVGLSVDQNRSTVSLGGGGGGTWRLETKELGGILSNGIWGNIPQYARGTLNAGSVFAAGEHGPELVGHVNGRTEVLNRSQIASAIFSAVQAAMATAVNSIASIANVIYSESNGASTQEGIDALMEIVRQGSEATVHQNELLKEQNEYLRAINDKEFTADVSLYSIQQAQARQNRRVGTTITPVGAAL